MRRILNLNTLFWLFFVLVFTFGALGVWASNLSNEQILEYSFLIDVARFVSCFAPLLNEVAGSGAGLNSLVFYAFAVLFWLAFFGANFLNNYGKSRYPNLGMVQVAIYFAIVCAVCVGLLGGYVFSREGLDKFGRYVNNHAAASSEIYDYAFAMAGAVLFAVLANLACDMIYKLRSKNE